MLVMTLDPRLDWSERWRMGGMMTLAMGFAIAGARQTFASGQRLEETQARLRESEAHYRMLADNVIDVICAERRRRQAALHVALDRGGARLPDRGALRRHRATYIYPDDRPAVGQMTAAVLHRRPRRTCEYRVIRRDGGWSGSRPTSPWRAIR